VLSSTQVNGHPNQTVLANVVVPGIVMSIIRIGAINSTVETTDARALCYLLNQLKEFFVVHQKQQSAGGGVFLQAKFFVGVDTFVDLFIELAAVDLLLNQIKQ